MENKKCVLIVDDDPSILRVVSRILEEHYEVLTAKDGVEGFTIADSKPVDLIILDLSMPRIDGFSLASMLRDHDLTRDIPILILTGLDDRSDELHAFDSGADMYLTKPFDAEELWVRTESLIGRAAARL